MYVVSSNSIVMCIVKWPSNVDKKLKIQWHFQHRHWYGSYVINEDIQYIMAMLYTIV